MNNVKSIINIGFISIYGRTIDIIADIWKFEIENSKMFMMRNKNIGVFFGECIQNFNILFPAIFINITVI